MYRNINVYTIRDNIRRISNHIVNNLFDLELCKGFEIECLDRGLEDCAGLDEGCGTFGFETLKKVCRVDWDEKLVLAWNLD